MVERAHGQFVPVVSIEPFRFGGRDDQLRVAAAVGDACARHGFLSVVGHGVDPTLIEHTRLVASAFFDLPTDEKNLIRVNATGTGYVPFALEALAASRGDRTPGDLKESLNAGRDHEANQWPERPALLRGFWTAYFEQMNVLASTMMQLFAMALGMRDDFFADKIDQPQTFMRAINYPDQPNAPEAGQLRAGAHTDYGTLTILLSENKPGGLQVLAPEGHWIDVVAVENSFVINIGDMMQQWTNDRWRSTLHRVVNPPHQAGLSTRRLSLVFFHNPNPYAMIAPLDVCVDATHPVRYQPIMASEHLRAKSERAGGLGKT